MSTWHYVAAKKFEQGGVTQDRQSVSAERFSAMFTNWYLWLYVVSVLRASKA